MNKKEKKATLLAGLKKSLKIGFEDDTARKEFVTEDGTKIYANELTQNSEVYDGGNNLLANAEFVYDGKVYITDENGRIVSITEKQTDESVEFTEDELEVIQEIVDEVKEEAKDILAEKDAKIKELEAEVADLKAKLATKESEVIQMKANKKGIKAFFGGEQNSSKTGGFLGTLRKHV